MVQHRMGGWCKLLIWKAVGKTYCYVAVIYIAICLESLRVTSYPVCISSLSWEEGLFFLPWRNNPEWARASSLSRLHDHTQTRHTRQDSSGRVISPTQRPLPDNTQHLQETDIHAVGEIRTRNPSKRTAQTHALDCAGTGIGRELHSSSKSAVMSPLNTSSAQDWRSHPVLRW
jgi:hypothetical protein